MEKVPLEVPHPLGAYTVSNEATGAVVTLSGRLALTVPEAAAAVGVSERHLRAMLAEIPHLRLGNRVVIPVEPFRDWLRERAQSEANAVDRAVEDVLADLE